MSAKKAITPTTPKSTMQSTTSQQSPIVIQSLKTTPSTSSSKTTMLEEDENANELSMEFEQQLNELESLLNPFFQLNSEDLHRKLTQQELAQLDIIRAYCINTLFYSMKINMRFDFFCFLVLNYFNDCYFFCFELVFLKTQGVSTAEHPVKEELVKNNTIFFVCVLFFCF